MSPRIWDPYSVLNIIDRNDDTATCVGKTKFNKRCRWDISDENVREIPMILDEREKRHPKYAKKSLKILAELSLCNDYHQGQASQVIEAWKAAIDDAEANLVTDSQTINDLKLKLQERKIKIALQSKSLQLAAENEDALQNKVERQRSQLSQLVGQGRDLEQVTKELGESLVRIKKLEAQRSIVHKKSNRLEHDLVQAAVKQVSLSQELSSIQQHRATELGIAADLRIECDNVKTELSNAQNSILEAQLNLENSDKARDAQKTELDSLRITLGLTMAELTNSHVATEKQTAKLYAAQNEIKRAQLDLQTLSDTNVELETNLTAALSTLKQTRLDFENNLETAEKQQAEFAKVHTTLDQTVVELVNSRKSNEEQEKELSIVKELLQQTELDLEVSRRKVDENQKAHLEYNLKANEEQKAELASAKVLFQASQVELEIGRKTALEQKEAADAAMMRVQAQIIELEKQLSRGFMDRVVLRFKMWFATVMRGIRAGARGGTKQGEEGSLMMV
ncbi:hypothetical protein V502_06151 [Pseudogymnoascus sp. VKM F-4520 (FW-2644)]|nr:hypothetical protein V502_06151 [Pseudogymnoascus sp. VKM F-4520 (FW-2644)]